MHVCMDVWLWKRDSAFLMWMLGTELGSSPRAAITLYYWIISLAPKTVVSFPS